MVFFGTPVFSTNKTDCHDITEILLKGAINTINHLPEQSSSFLLHNVFASCSFGDCCESSSLDEGDDLAPGLFLKNGACHYGLLKVHHVHVDIYD
jgi:hypothetical protein